ncbi:MAG: hypothetical protein ABL999_16080 [Pyrinomonadaceae bacterium]
MKYHHDSIFHKVLIIFVLLFGGVGISVFALSEAVFRPFGFVSEASVSADPVSPAPLAPTDTPTVVTDKVRYLAGEVVNISGSGFAPNSNVRIKVVHADNTAESGGNHEESTVSVNAEGAFGTTWQVGLDQNGFLFTVVTESAANVSFGRVANVATNKFDYNSGETAVITGEGFNPGENVTLLVVHSNGRTGGAGHLPFTVIADSAGRVNTTWYVNPDDSADSIFRLTAHGASSGIEASTSFTDIVSTIVDDGGPDDNPNQKDLTFVTIDSDVSFGTQAVTWGWDDTSWNGNNTGDACVLYDNDGDGNNNFALCVTISNTARYAHCDGR